MGGMTELLESFKSLQSLLSLQFKLSQICSVQEVLFLQITGDVCVGLGGIRGKMT